MPAPDLAYRLQPPLPVPLDLIFEGECPPLLRSSQEFTSILQRLHKQYLHEFAAWSAAVQSLEIQLRKTHTHFDGEDGGMNGLAHEHCLCSISDAKLKAAEHGTGTIEVNGSVSKDLDHLELQGRSIKHWGTLVQGALFVRDSGYAVREDWLKSAPTGTRALEVQAKLDMILARPQHKATRRFSEGANHHFIHLPTFHSGLQQVNLVAHPDSFSRRAWVWLSLLIILYEVMAITMMPFDAFGEDRASILEAGSAMFWTCDIIITFFTGVFIHGRLEVRLRVIARRYLTTWFVFDFMVAGMQVLSLFASTGRASTSGTLFKIIRVVRALRLGRSMPWMQAAFARVLSSRFSVFWARVGQCLVVLYFFVHLNACLWYEIGKSSHGWVSGFDKLGDSSGAGEKYLVAMHWSLSQLQGNVDIYPGRAATDRLYVVLSSFVSIIFLALLVSTMTDALFTAQEERKIFFKQKRMVESFFRRHHIKPALRKRAEHYLRLRNNAEHSMAYEDQDRQALEMFPLQLKWRLLAESRAPILAWHAVFYHLQNVHATLFAHVCTDALLWLAYQPEDDTFMNSTRSTGAYYIMCGQFLFTAKVDLVGVLNPWLEGAFDSQSKAVADIAEASMNASGSGLGMASQNYSVSSSYQNLLRNNRSPVTRLHTGQLVSEVSLWSPWSHAGDMSAVSHGQCFNIRWSELVTLLAQYTDPNVVLSSYAVRFVNAAKKLRSRERSDQSIELMGCADLLDIEMDFK